MILDIEVFTMALIKEGSVIKGKVTGIQPYGVFVSLGRDIMGLIHISELTDEYVKDINEYVQVGDIVRVKVLEIDYENKTAKLSLKQAQNYYTRFLESRKKKTKAIEETPSGFANLKNMVEKLTNKR